MRLDFTLFALAAPLAVFGDLRHSQRRTHSHHEIAKRAGGDVQLHKRSFTNTRWTFYEVGGAPGACGKYNTKDQFIVALNSQQYGGGYPGPHCWQTITMQIGDITATATITDECPGCPYGGLDLTEGLFQHFAPLGKGVLSGTWWFNDDGGDSPPPAPKPTQKPKPTTTWKPDPPKTTTHYTPHTTSTAEKTSTSTTHESSTHSSTHSSSATADATSSVSHSSAAAAATGAASAEVSNVQNILTCNKVLVNMGGLVVAGGQA